jgi:hypothetical protein
MKYTRALITWLVATTAATFGFLASAHAQGITTAAMNGLVTDATGKAIPNATVTIVDESTNTRTTTVTRSNGRYNMSGLRLGGPYTVTVSATGHEAEPQKNIFLGLNDDIDVSFQMAEHDVVVMGVMEVTASRDTIFGVGRMGAGTSITAAELARTATMRENIQDIAKMDSRITLNSLDQGGQMSAQGQNFRYNSFLVDGVESNDPFGLNSNGFGSLRSPVALESLQAVSIDLMPYDLRRSNFTGVLINAVTKSGSNEFHGKAYLKYSDSNLRGRHPLNSERDLFHERTWGFTFGGPIVKNKLFFFLSYDDYFRKTVAPAAGISFDDASLMAADTQGVMRPVKEVIQDIINVAKTKYNYDPGTLTGGSNTSSQKTYLAKIDWNISDEHKLAITYRRSDGDEPRFPGYTSSSGISLSNYWFQQPRVTNSYTAQLNSRWTPNFNTEVALLYSDYEASPANNGAPFPSVGIRNIPAIRLSDGQSLSSVYLNMGTEYSRQMNEINTNQWLGKFTGEYSIGNHTIVFGLEYDRSHYNNKYLQNYYGQYNFNSAKLFADATPYQYTVSKLNPGFTKDDNYAEWTYEVYSPLIQDTWKGGKNLTVTGGLRLDYPHADRAPRYNQAFETAFGIRNDTTSNGNFVVSPRIGFVYELPAATKTQVRGGIGLFQGRNPVVWIANAYQNAGAAGTVTANGTDTPSLTFSPDVNNQPSVAGNPPVPTINVTGKDFKAPSLWKGNIAIDHKLPYLDLILGAEIDFTKVEKGLYIEFLNYKVATTGEKTMPDGRIRYAGTIYNGLTGSTSTAGRRNNPNFGDVYRLNNTSEGHSRGFTLSLKRPMKNHWSAGIAWTTNEATEVSPMTSSTAGSLYTTRAAYNPNENVASTSNTNSKNKINAYVAYEFEFVKKYKTTVSLFYEGRNGRPYSWVFKGDANGDGISGNDLFYVPTGPNDPNVKWANTTERDDFFVFAGQSGLMKYAGTVTQRNSETSPWTESFDIAIRQELPIYRKVKAELFLNLINFANLLNKKSGVQHEVPFSYKRAVAGTTYDEATKQYIYTFGRGTTLDDVAIAAEETISSTSRWFITTGVSISF